MKGRAISSRRVRAQAQEVFRNSARRRFCRARLGRGLTNAQPQPYWRELDEGEVVGREFVVASCDPTTLLDVVDEPLDQISGTVEIRAEADQVVTIAFCGILAQTPLLAARALIQSAS
jgi:hypothetical protein